VSGVDGTISSTIRALIAGSDKTLAGLMEATGAKRSTLFNRFKTGGWTATEVSAAANYLGVEVAELYDGLGGRFAPTTNSDCSRRRMSMSLPSLARTAA
jgi:hypothetical protein